MKDILQQARQLAQREIENFPWPGEPRGLYEPAEYLLRLGGKRMRPALCLMGGALYGCEMKRCLPAALAVEILHNFTLMHDDIMDEAPVRRGHASVHHKWDLSTAILSGDAMMITAYRQLEAAGPGLLPQLFSVFNRCSLQICEGQQWDMDFERRDDVEEGEYIRMIEYKTSVLLGASLQMGAIIGGAPEREHKALYDFGVLLGIAFQIRDDYLDVYGQSGKTGKQKGGDILAGKKTLLLIHALNTCSEKRRRELRKWLKDKNAGTEKKVDTVTAIFSECGTADYVCRVEGDYYRRALAKLDELLEARPEVLGALRLFAEEIQQRES